METLTRQRGGVWADTPVDNECGNEVVEGIEECDDGNTDAGDGCAADCTTELVEGVCGDGTLNTGEECDDGDTDAGDGCSATCTVEEGFTCTNEPSVCTEAIDGAALYATNCAECHNPLATTSKLGRTAVQIQTAIDNGTGGMDTAALQALTQEEIQAIADAL